MLCLDPIAIRKIERVYEMKLTPKQIDECLVADGRLFFQDKNGNHHIVKIDVLRFPQDFISRDVEEIDAQQSVFKYGE